MKKPVIKKIVRKKGNKGQVQRVQCDSCGKKIPRDKSIRVRKHAIPMALDLLELIRKQGGRVHTGEVILNHCISCARHRGIIK